MTDYVAFDKDFKIAYSIYEAIELKEKEIVIDYYCLCTKPLFVKGESIEFVNKKGIVIQRAAHFSHYKNCNCIVKEAFKSNDKSNNYYADAPEITDEDKRVNILMKIIKKYYKSTYKYRTAKNLIKNAINIAINNKIYYKNNLNEYIERILYNPTKGIGFKEIEFTDIDFNNEIYIIIDVMNETISHSYIKKICNDFERYKVYVKKLSIISLFASRCIDFDKIDLTTNMFIQELEDKINIYKKEQVLRLINLDKL
jgi:hypothetical protein